MKSFPIAVSSFPDLGVIRPDRCALVTDSGARTSDVVDKASVNDYRGVLPAERNGKKHTSDFCPFEGCLEANCTQINTNL